MLTTLALLLGPALASTDAPEADRIAVEAVAIAHCTRSLSQGGLVPPSLREELDRALGQRIDRGQLVSHPFLHTRVGTPAKVFTGHRTPQGTDLPEFALTVDFKPLDTGGVEYSVTAKVHHATSSVRFGGGSALGWVLSVPAAPDLACRGKRVPETLIAVMPQVLEDDTSMEDVLERTRAARQDTPKRGDLMADLLADLPTWF